MDLSNTYSEARIQIGHVGRWIGWTAIWASQHPEICTMNDWKNSPMLVAGSIAQFIFAGVLLEVAYRKLMWGRIKPISPFITAIAPECPGHPWISLMDRIPPDNVGIEVFCADGIARSARAAHQEEEARLKFDIEFEEKAWQQLPQMPWKFKPTHWRFRENDVSDVF